MENCHGSWKGTKSTTWHLQIDGLVTRLKVDWLLTILCNLLQITFASQTHVIMVDLVLKRALHTDVFVRLEIMEKDVNVSVLIPLLFFVNDRSVYSKHN